MLSWAVRLILVAANFVAGFFVAEDALNFEIIQGVISLFLVALVVFILAFWPSSWTRFFNNLGKKT
ncbi:MAG: hypothetical protein LCH93_12240 [Proteobacteria bacterium]|nr:hypothetical protein [Pseudomonadota bacterium]